MKVLNKSSEQHLPLLQKDGSWALTHICCICFFFFKYEAYNKMLRIDSVPFILLVSVLLLYLKYVEA